MCMLVATSTPNGAKANQPQVPECLLQRPFWHGSKGKRKGMAILLAPNFETNQHLHFAESVRLKTAGFLLALSQSPI